MEIEILSKREREVALLVSEGMTNKEIAALLNVSQRRVGAIIFKIKEKLVLNSKVEIGIAVYEFQKSLEFEAVK